MFKSTNNINNDIKEDGKSLNDNTYIERSLRDEKNKNLINQNSNKDVYFNNKNNEENDFKDLHKEVHLDEIKPKMTKEEVESLIDNRRSELDIRLFDLVTKNQIEEKKIEELYINETNEEQKANLLRKLEEEIKNNENNLAMIKEYNILYTEIN